MIEVDSGFGEGLIHCDIDGCYTEESYQGMSFLEILTEAQQNGWRVYQDLFNKWVHKCPKCVKSSTAKRQKLYLHGRK